MGLLPGTIRNDLQLSVQELGSCRHTRRSADIGKRDWELVMGMTHH